MGSTFAPPTKAGKQGSDRGERKVADSLGPPQKSPSIWGGSEAGGGAAAALTRIPRRSTEEMDVHQGAGAASGAFVVHARLIAGGAGDHLEQEAESFANGAQGEFLTGQTGAMSPAGTAPGANVPSMRSLLGGLRGEPLDDRTRDSMEPRLGMGLGGVRVHTGPRAAEHAQQLNAEAFTVGSDIVFNTGRYAPGSEQGGHLLAHELAHVAQQAAGRGTGTVQRQATKQADSQVIIFKFKLMVSHAMNPDETLREFLKQYFRLSSEAAVAEKLKEWKMDFGGEVTAADAQRGYVFIRVTTTFREYYGLKTDEEKAGINAETDQRFWASSGYKPGQKLGTSAEDQRMAKEWMKTRQSVMGEEIQRKEIDDLPKDIKEMLFTGDADAQAITPADYGKVLKLAAKLMQLTPAQRADYQSRIKASTSSYDDLDLAIDAYLAQQTQRQGEDQAADTAGKPLFGLENLFDTYKWWKASNGGRYTHMQRGGSYKTNQSDRDAAREAEFFAELRRQDFHDVGEFEKAIEAYRIAFRTQTVSMALDGLDRYEHMLYVEKKKFEKKGSGEAISKGIAGSKAAEHYKSAHEAATKAGELDAMNPGDGPNAAVDAMEAKYKEEKQQGDTEVVKGADDQLVAERGIDLEKLAGLDASGTQQYLLEQIKSRQEQVKATRAEFAEDPDRVFSLPPLLAASMRMQGIEKTIYASIIEHYVEQEGLKKLFTTIAVTIIALALAALVPVGGVVAAAALIAGAGISTYQAYQAYEEYKVSERDYTLHFLDDQASFGWVVLAVVAAAVDMGVATSQVFKMSAAGLAKLEGPLKTFQREKDAKKLADEIEKITELDKRVQLAMERQSKAEEDAVKAWEKAGGTPLYGTLPHPLLVLGAYVAQYARPLYASLKRGIRTFAALRKDAEFLKAMGDITKMTGADRKVVEQAFEELKGVVAAGKKMDEPTLLTYVDRWAAGRSQGEAFQQRLLDEMKVWRPMSEAQKSAMSALGDAKGLVATLYEEKAAYLAEWKLLRAKPTRTKAEIERIQEIFGELRKLDPKWQEAELSAEEARRFSAKDPHPAPGDIEKAQGALDRAEEAARKADITLYDRLRAAAPGEAAKDAALKGVAVDQVGPLKTKPTALQVDHIVSVNEIAEMDGFKDLPWADQKRIVDMKENLVVMDGSANASKSNRTWRSWPQWSTYYDEATKVKMITAEDVARKTIQDEIKRLRTIPVGH